MRERATDVDSYAAMLGEEATAGLMRSAPEPLYAMNQDVQTAGDAGEQDPLGPGGGDTMSEGVAEQPAPASEAPAPAQPQQPVVEPQAQPPVVEPQAVAAQPATQPQPVAEPVAQPAVEPAAAQPSTDFRTDPETLKEMEGGAVAPT